MSTRIFKAGRSTLLVAAAALFAYIGSAAAQSSAALAPMAPGYQRVELMPVTPAQADAAIKAWRRPANLISPAMSSTRTPASTLTPSTSSQRVSGDNAAVGPASLDELARALKNDPDLIYEYVRNNIEYYPVWGVQKGALGAVLDNQGTAFDQALLMVELLRKAGYTASVVKGEIDLTAAMVQEWLGVDVTKACPVVMRFASGGVPITAVNSTGINCPADQTTGLTSIRIGHVWVSATINNTAYVFDPSYKSHTLKQSLNIASIAGYSQNTFLSRAKSGATEPDANTIQGLNRANIRSDLTSMATSLAGYLRQNVPSGTIDDVVGGRTITPKASGLVRQTTLAYQASSPTPVVLADSAIDAYKPTLRVQYAGIDQTFTSDAIYGKRLTITYDASSRAVLTRDGAVVQTGNVVASGATDSVTLSVVHNGYSGVSANQSWPQSIKAGAGNTYVISNGWGPMGRGTIDKFRAQLDEARDSGAADGSELVLGSALAVLSATWIAQVDHAAYLTDRIAKTNTIAHHRFGIAGYSGSAYVDLPGNLVSVVSEVGATDKEKATFYAGSMHMSVFESAAVQQAMGVAAVSTVKLIDIEGTNTLHNVTSANLNAVLDPLIAANPQKCTAADKAAVNSWLQTNGGRVIMPGNCKIVESSWRGLGYFGVSSDGQSIGAIISGGLFGGFGTIPQTPPVVATNALSLTGSPWGTFTQTTGSFWGDPIDMTKGSYTHAHDDISVGVGGFPHALSFQRLYSSGARLKGGQLGRGWAHNLNASVSIGSDGFQGMGEDSALDAATSVVEIMVSLDLLNDAAKPLDKMVIATLAQRWFADQLLDNTVVVSQGLNGEVFTKLPDGSYNPPPGSSAKLTKETDGSYTYETVNRAKLKFNAVDSSATSGKITTYTLASGVQAKFSYTSGNLTQVQNSLGRQLNLTVTNNRIDSINDGNGRSVSYAYSASTVATSANLLTFTNAESKATTFEYDLPGRMTKLFYPSAPTAPFLVNVYDTLGRVKTQTNAAGKLYTYYFAGSRSEEQGPDMGGGVKASNASYVDGMGRVLRAVDAAGRITTNTYDGAGRLAKSVAPEGNSVEYAYDDATCAASEKRCTHNIKTVTQRAKTGSALTPLVSSFLYETAFNKPSSSTNARNKTTDYFYVSTHGEPDYVEGPAAPDGNRPRTTFGYTSYTPASGSGFAAFYLPTSQTRKITASASVVNATSYNTAANKFVPLNSTVDSGSGTLNLTTAFVYDAVGNLQNVDGPRSDVADTTGFTYDNERRLLTTTDALGRITKIRYDADGRPERTAAQAPGANTWLVSCTRYTATGKPTRNWGPALGTSDTACPAESAPVPIVDTEYDELDRPFKVTQSLTAAEGGNRITQTQYNLDGKVQNLKRAVGNSLQQTYAAYTYTANGLPQTLTDARGYLSRFEYDDFDRRYKLKYPSPTTTGVESSTDYEQYGYDENGNVTTQRRRSGQSITLAYDNLDRLTSRTYTDTALNVGYTHDLLGRRKTAGFANASHSLGYDWDNAGRLKTATAGGKTLNYQYDAAGNRTRITWPEATAFYVSTDYDALNRPTKIKELDSNSAVLADYSAYDELSRRSSVALGNGTSTSYAYGAQGALSGISHDLTGTAKDVAYSYARNQAQEIVTQTWSNNAYQWQPGFDRNRGYSANGLNQYGSYGPGSLTHDSAGNISGDGTWAWGYDADNQLKTAASPGVSIQLAYDAAGRMRQESLTTGGSTTTTQFLYDGTDLIAEYDGSGNLLRRYVHGPGIDEPIVSYEGSGTAAKEWLYADHLGSVVAGANSSGTSTTAQGYGPFGEPTQTTGSRFKYTGQTFMPNLGLYYYKARFYAPGIGRFLQTDPIGYDGGLHLYSYTSNNPINLNDPSGLIAADVRALAGRLGDGIGFRAPTWEQFRDHFDPSRTSFAQAAGTGLASFGAVAWGAITGNDALAQAGFDGASGLGLSTGDGLAMAISLGMGGRSGRVANPVPGTMARVIPGEGNFPTLGPPSGVDVFVTAASDIVGMNSTLLSQRLTIAPSQTYTIITFPTPKSGVASPVNRSNPGFVGGGRTAGGAREYVIPNGPLPPGSTTKVIGP